LGGHGLSMVCMGRRERDLPSGPARRLTPVRHRLGDGRTSRSGGGKGPTAVPGPKGPITRKSRLDRGIAGASAIRHPRSSRSLRGDVLRLSRDPAPPSGPFDRGRSPARAPLARRLRLTGGATGREAGVVWPRNVAAQSRGASLVPGSSVPAAPAPPTSPSASSTSARATTTAGTKRTRSPRNRCASCRA